MTSIHFIWLISQLFFFYGCICNAALTFWIDSSCITNHNTDVQRTLLEINRVCLAADAKMAAPLPPDLDIGFRYLFGDKEFQITDALVTQVKGTQLRLEHGIRAKAY